jgi:hypothetical protein
LIVIVRDNNVKKPKAELDLHRFRLGEDWLSDDQRQRRSTSNGPGSDGGRRSGTVRFSMRHKRWRDSQNLHNLSISLSALQLDAFLVITRGVSLRDRVGIWARGRVGVRSNILKVNNGDVAERAGAAVILDTETQGDISDGFSFDSNQDRREINACEAHRVYGMRVCKGARGVGNKVVLPLLNRVAAKREGSEGFMLKKEPIISFIVAAKEDRGFPADEGAIGNGILPILWGGEDSETGADG